MSSFSKVLQTSLFGHSWTESRFDTLNWFLEGALYKYLERMNEELSNEDQPNLLKTTSFQLSLIGIEFLVVCEMLILYNSVRHGC